MISLRGLDVSIGWEMKSLWVSTRCHCTIGRDRKRCKSQLHLEIPLNEWTTLHSVIHSYVIMAIMVRIVVFVIAVLLIIAIKNWMEPNRLVQCTNASKQYCRLPYVWSRFHCHSCNERNSKSNQSQWHVI